jgi:hypothetical protein
MIPNKVSLSFSKTTLNSFHNPNEPSKVTDERESEREVGVREKREKRTGVTIVSTKLCGSWASGVGHAVVIGSAISER